MSRMYSVLVMQNWLLLQQECLIQCTCQLLSTCRCIFQQMYILHDLYCGCCVVWTRLTSSSAEIGLMACQPVVLLCKVLLYMPICVQYMHVYTCTCTRSYATCTCSYATCCSTLCAEYCSNLIDSRDLTIYEDWSRSASSR